MNLFEIFVKENISNVLINFLVKLVNYKLKKKNNQKQILFDI